MYNVSVSDSLTFSEFLPLVRHCQKVRGLPTDADTVQHVAERLFACENAFTEEQFIHVMGPSLGDIFRLPLFLGSAQTEAPAATTSHTSVVDVTPSLPVKPVDIPDKWACAACTFRNFAASARCSMCNEAKGATGPLIDPAATAVVPIPVIPSVTVSPAYRAALTPDDWLWLDACVALVQASDKSKFRTDDDMTRCIEKLSALLALPKPPLERVISGWSIHCFACYLNG
jgi:hypothetical protein